MIGGMLNNLMTKYKKTKGGSSDSMLANLHSPVNFRSTNSLETNVEDVIHGTHRKVIYGGMEEERHIHKKRKKTDKEVRMADKEFASAEEKMRDKLVKVEQENVALQAKVSSLESEFANKMEELKVAKDLQTSLTKVEVEADTLWKKVADLRAESFELVESIRKDNEENEVALDNKAKKEWATCLEAVKERDEATKEVDFVCVQSFVNAVEQIKVLNPGVELKLDGLDCNKIVKDGHIVGE